MRRYKIESVLICKTVLNTFSHSTLFMEIKHLISPIPFILLNTSVFRKQDIQNDLSDQLIAHHGCSVGAT